MCRQGLMEENYLDFSKIKKVLIAKLRHHGDVLLTSPIFSLLHSRFPYLKIDAYIYQETLPMLEGHPAISNFLLYDKEWKKLPFFKRYLKEIGLLKKIRERNYDLVINLTEGDRGAIAAKISKCQYSVGFDPEGKGMMKKKECYTHIVKHTPQPRHTVEKQLDALRCLGLFPSVDERELFFHIPLGAKENVNNLLAAFGIEAGQFIQIHPVSRWMFKALPIDHIVELITLLHQKGEKIVLTASSDPSEMKMNQEICNRLSHIPICDLSGKITLKELGAVIEMSRLLISIDSLPVHISSALQTPAVAIFGPTSEINWGPWRNPNSRIVTNSFSCRPCYQPGCGGSRKSDCLETLSPQKIYEAAVDFLH